MVVKLPTAADLPSYQQTIKSIKEGNRQCIWYIPYKGSNCSAEISITDYKAAFKLAKLLNLDDSQDLQRLFRLKCCKQFHRHLAEQGDLALFVAEKWLDELTPDSEKTTSSEAKRSQESNDRKSTLRSAARYRDHLSPQNTNDNTRASGKRISESITPDLPVFEPHVSEPDENVLQRLLRAPGRPSTDDPVTARTGSIYIFQVKAFPGFVKIGFTNASVDARLKYWSKCGYGNAELVAQFGNVPMAKRAEGLIHGELHKLWRRQMTCHQHLTSHVEWFAVDAAQAVVVCESWTRWFKEARPYDDNQVLAEKWRDIIWQLRLYEVEISGTLLMDLHALSEDQKRLDEFLKDFHT